MMGAQDVFLIYIGLPSLHYYILITQAFVFTVSIIQAKGFKGLKELDSLLGWERMGQDSFFSLGLE